MCRACDCSGVSVVVWHASVAYGLFEPVWNFVLPALRPVEVTGMQCSLYIALLWSIVWLYQTTTVV